MPEKKIHHSKEQDDVFFPSKFYYSPRDTVILKKQIAWSYSIIFQNQESSFH